ncbi:sigma-70 family RNA polymerase sigma factor [bacterium]|nr:sigma-70 family RNA polymerase sigma factor [bacterium]
MDPELLGRLIDRHAPALELYARQWCGSAEDVVQEAFVRLAVLETTPENPVAWLFRVVRNGAVNAGIASRRRKRHEEAAAANGPAWFQPDAGSEFDPDIVQVTLASLPIEQREVIVAHLWGGLSFQEIAELVHTSRSSVHRRYQAGIVTLRELMGVSCPARSNPKDPTNPA